MNGKAKALADVMHDWSFAKKWGTMALSRETQEIQARYRAKLRQAQRFVLDDDAVRLVCHLSHQFDRFDAWSILSRLPYRTMFVELDLHVKVKEYENMGTLGFPFNPNEVAPRMGLLLYLDAEEPSPRWICHQFLDNVPIGGSEILPTQSCPSMLAYVFDPEGEPINPVKGSKFWRAPTLSLVKDMPRSRINLIDKDGRKVMGMCDPEYILCGKLKPRENFAAHRQDGSDIYIADEPLVDAPEWFVARSAAIIDPWWRARCDNMLKDERHRMTVLNDIIGQVNEESGGLRWIIALLGAINELPKDVKPIISRVGTRSVYGHNLPFFTQSHLKILLPRDDRVVWARKKLDHSAGETLKRKRGTVRGHWKIVEYGKKVPGYQCRHIPVIEDKWLAICQKCELLIRWVTDFERGDASLGYVYHTYEVEAKRQTPDIELKRKG
jgi:hypothetical protein